MPLVDKRLLPKAGSGRLSRHWPAAYPQFIINIVADEAAVFVHALGGFAGGLCIAFQIELVKLFVGSVRFVCAG